MRLPLPWRGQSRFARNIWLVARANVLAQALPVLAAPLLTRLYAPADFGLLAVCASWLSLALAVGTGRFEWSLPNARSTGMAAALVAWAGIVLGCACVLGLAAVLTAGFGVGGLAGTAASGGRTPWPIWPSGGAALGAAAWLLPLALLGAGVQQVLQAWHVRAAELSAVGRAKVSQGIANVAVALAVPLAWPGAGLWGLLLGVLAGAWVGITPLWRQATGLPAALARLSAARLAVARRRFGVEALWSALAAAANTASFAVVPLLLSMHFSAAEVGWYALMQRVALGPVSLVGSAVSQSFWAEAARLVRRDVPALRRLYLRSMGRLLLLALPLALLALAGPWYVGRLFGVAQWQGAGVVLAASVPMLIGQAVASPVSHLVIHRRQHWQALWDAARVLLLVAVVVALGRAGAGLATTVLGVSAVMAVMYGVLVLLNLRALRLAAA